MRLKPYFCPPEECVPPKKAAESSTNKIPAKDCPWWLLLYWWWTNQDRDKVDFSSLSKQKLESYSDLYDAMEAEEKVARERSGAKQQELELRTVDAFLRGFLVVLFLVLPFMLVVGLWDLYEYAIYGNTWGVKFLNLWFVCLQALPFIEGYRYAKDYKGRAEQFVDKCRSIAWEWHKSKLKKKADEVKARHKKREDMRSANLIRVRMPDGSTGKINKKDFNPAYMTELK